jgi:hypothetical protein
MRPFLVTEAGRRLSGTYPEHQLVRDLTRSMSPEEKLGFLRLWVSEGIPFAFKDIPILYDIVRGWLGRQLNVHAKCITIIGSARLGYSLSPAPKFGKPFSGSSDLDLAVVADTTFQELSREFWTWKTDLLQGKIQPRNDRERGFWDDNLTRLPQNIARGFLDPHKIPPRYPAVQRVNNTVWCLKEKLALTAHSPEIKRASLRVYRDWQAFIGQNMLNYSRTLTADARSQASLAP